LNAALAGTAGSTAYGVTISGRGNGGVPGTFTFGPNAGQGTVPTVQLSDQSPSGTRRWSAGFAQVAPGAGTITIGSDGGGSIDDDMQPPPGTSSNVHLKGSWRCAQPLPEARPV